MKSKSWCKTATAMLASRVAVLALLLSMLASLTFADQSHADRSNSSDPHARSRALIGAKAPEFPRDGWVGNSRPPAKGPYLLYFWAQWVGPIAPDRRIAQLNGLRAKGLNVVGIHYGSSQSGIEKAVHRHNIKFPVLAPEEIQGDAEKPMTLLNFPISTLPCCILVDESSIIRAAGSQEEVLAYWRKSVELPDAGNAVSRNHRLNSH